MTQDTLRLSEMTVSTGGRPYQLHYFDRASTGPAILYIHGLGCSKADFMEMTSAVDLQPFRLISADNPGCGDSPYEHSEPLNIDGIVELIENFVANLGLDSLLLVGGSLGGLVALLFAERNLNRLTGFINVEGNLAPEDCMFSRNVIPHSYSHFERVIFPQIKKAVSARRGRGFAQHLNVLAGANPRAYYDYAFQTVEYSDNGNLLQRFLSLPIPKCFLYGSENRQLSYLQRLRESNCTVIEIPNANHFLFYDAPDGYAAALASFARRHARAIRSHSRDHRSSQRNYWRTDMNHDSEDKTVYKVVVNHEEQYSIWPAHRENALGWKDAGKNGAKDECLAYIKEVWTDMRPLSLRKKMQEQGLA